MGCCNESSAEQYAAGQMHVWLEQLREAVRVQLLAAEYDGEALVSHLAGNLIYTLRNIAGRAYNAGWRQGYKEAR